MYPNFRIDGRVVLVRAIVLACACACVPAYADPFDSFHPYFGATESYDANLLGFANSAEAQQTVGSPQMSDTSHVEQLGVAFDDMIGLQHITADLNESKANFEHFTGLDYHAPSARGNWNWELGNHLSGNLGASYVQSLAPYTFLHAPILNLSTQRRANADAEWRFHPSWKVDAGFTSTQTRYELEDELAEDRSEYRANLGLDYIQANGSTTGVQLVQLRGYFPFPQYYGTIGIINNYVQDEVDAKIDWHLTGKTRLQFVGGWVERKYDVLPDQNYRGVNARAIFDWSITGKTSLNAAVWHEIGAVDNLTTVYSINRGVSVAPTWQISGKLRGDLQLKTEQRAYAQTPTVFDMPTSGVTYYLHNAAAQLTYMATPHWQIQGSIYYLSQSTSDHTNDFSGSGIACSTRYQF